MYPDLVTAVMPDYATITMHNTPHIVLKLSAIGDIYGVAFN